MKHTPVPLTYELGECTGKNWTVAIVDLGRQADGTIARGYITTDGVQASRLRFGEPEADLRLWSAAPEMYEALEAVEWISTSGEWWVCPWCMGAKHEGHRPDCQRQDALARAKGEQP